MWRKFVANFTQNTGFHGISFFGARKYIASIWVLTCAGFGLWECQKTITSYLEFNVQTTVVRKEADRGVIPFPAITFCSNNGFIKSAVGGTQSLLINSYASIGGMNTREAIKWSNTCFNSSLPNQISEHGDGPITENLLIRFPGGFPAAMRMSQIDSEKSILNCTQSGRTFDCSRQFLNKGTDFGFCFTFNGAASIANSYPLEGKPCDVSFFLNGSTVHIYAANASCPDDLIRAYGTTSEERVIFKSVFSGPLSGIRFQLLSNESEYCTATSGAQTGFVAIVHDLDAEPILMTKHYLMLSPGYSHNIGMKVKRTVRLTEKFGYCKSHLFLKFYNETVAYTSKDKYIVDCLTSQILKKCGCLPYYAPPKSLFVLSLQVMFCNYPQTICQLEQERVELSTNGECFHRMPVPCLETQITTQMTSSLYGSHNNLQWLKRRYVNASRMDLSQFRRNYFSANFYMRTSTYVIATQKVAMTWVDLMNSLGGAVGMAVGMSLITITELLSLAVLKSIAGFKLILNVLMHKSRDERHIYYFE